MNRRKFRKSEHEETNFELQITALIDTLVIILIFMLKTTAMESLEIEQQKDLNIPMVNDGVTENTGSKNARLSINGAGVYWNGAQIITTENFQAISQDSKVGGKAWTQLSAVIQEAAKTASEGQTEKFQGKLMLEADKNTPYPLLDQALKVARQHGYKDILFVGARYN
jgi:biopolymer transport protein ExbD